MLTYLLIIFLAHSWALCGMEMEEDYEVTYQLEDLPIEQFIKQFGEEPPVEQSTEQPLQITLYEEPIEQFTQPLNSSNPSAQIPPNRNRIQLSNEGVDYLVHYLVHSNTQRLLKNSSDLATEEKRMQEDITVLEEEYEKNQRWFALHQIAIAINQQILEKNIEKYIKEYIKEYGHPIDDDILRPSPHVVPLEEAKKYSQKNNFKSEIMIPEELLRKLKTSE